MGAIEKLIKNMVNSVKYPPKSQEQLFTRMYPLFISTG